MYTELIVSNFSCSRLFTLHALYGAIISMFYDYPGTPGDLSRWRNTVRIGRKD